MSPSLSKAVRAEPTCSTLCEYFIFKRYYLLGHSMCKVAAAVLVVGFQSDHNYSVDG